MTSQEEKTYRELHEKRQEESERRILWLENRYSSFNDEFGSVKTDVKWLVKTYWVIVTSSIGAAVSAIANLILR